LGGTPFVDSDRWGVSSQASNRTNGAPMSPPTTTANNFCDLVGHDRSGSGKFQYVTNAA
jgi:hypothetical protein